jgi:uncharacterized protein (TIGR02594 family)
MPGLGYLLVLTSEENGKKLRTTELIEIRRDLQHVLKFDRNNWPPPADGTLKDAPTLSQPAAINVSSDLPAWMKAAYGELGQKEVPGSAHNPRILEYFRSAQIAAPPQDDETEWSSAFVHWVLRQSGINGTRSLANRSWLSWGVPTEVKPGCIAVFWRGSPDGLLGHVGFVVSPPKDNSLAILGGNQGDSVSIVSLPASRLLGCRWPS